eukprot:16367-Heterococcus_DN1.PRE.6
MKVGEFVVKLIKEMQYFGTMLPRIPVLIERKMKVQLLLHGEKKKRAAANESIKGSSSSSSSCSSFSSNSSNNWFEYLLCNIVLKAVAAVATFAGYSSWWQLQLMQWSPLGATCCSSSDEIDKRSNNNDHTAQSIPTGLYSQNPLDYKHAYSSGKK